MRWNWTKTLAIAGAVTLTIANPARGGASSPQEMFWDVIVESVEPAANSRSAMLVEMLLQERVGVDPDEQTSNYNVYLGPDYEAQLHGREPEELSHIDRYGARALDVWEAMGRGVVDESGSDLTADTSAAGGSPTFLRSPSLFEEQPDDVPLQFQMEGTADDEDAATTVSGDDNLDVPQLLSLGMNRTVDTSAARRPTRYNVKDLTPYTANGQAWFRRRLAQVGRLCASRGVSVASCLPNPRILRRRPDHQSAAFHLGVIVEPELQHAATGFLQLEQLPLRMGLLPRFSSKTRASILQIDNLGVKSDKPEVTACRLDALVQFSVRRALATGGTAHVFATLPVWRNGDKPPQGTTQMLADRAVFQHALSTFAYNLFQIVDDNKRKSWKPHPKSWIRRRLEQFGGTVPMPNPTNVIAAGEELAYRQGKPQIELTLQVAPRT